MSLKLVKLIKCFNSKSDCELIYINKVTGVKIRYEYREGYIFIMLYKLVNGELIENPFNIKSDTRLYGYGLDDLTRIIQPRRDCGLASVAQTIDLL